MMWAIKIFLVLLGVSQGSLWTIHVRYHEERMAIIRLPPALNRIIDSGKAPNLNPILSMFPNVSLQPDSHESNGTTVPSETDAEIIIQPIPSPPETNTPEGVIVEEIVESEEITADVIIVKSHRNEEESNEEGETTEESNEEELSEEYRPAEVTNKNNIEDFEDFIDDNGDESLQILDTEEDDFFQTIGEAINIAEKIFEIVIGEMAPDSASTLPMDFNTVAVGTSVEDTATSQSAVRTLSMSTEATHVTTPKQNEGTKEFSAEVLDNSIVPDQNTLTGHDKKGAAVMRVFYASGHDEMKSFMVSMFPIQAYYKRGFVLVQIAVGIMITSGFGILVALMWKITKQRQKMAASENGFDRFKV